MRKLLLVILLISSPVFSQNYDLNTGVVINESKEMNPGYFIGANFIIKTNQNRDYLNNLIFGFEHSAFMSNNKTVLISNNINPKSEIIESCNCTGEYFPELNSGDVSYKYKKEVRAVSLNFGVEVFKRFYLMTGVTNFQHITLVDNKKVNEYRTMQIDAGVKYFIKSNDWFFIPTFKFNPEIISFGVGVSYYKKKKDIRVQRALMLNKEAYTNQDLEFILFGEPQL